MSPISPSSWFGSAISTRMLPRTAPMFNDGFHCPWKKSQTVVPQARGTCLLHAFSCFACYTSIIIIVSLFYVIVVGLTTWAHNCQGGIYLGRHVKNVVTNAATTINIGMVDRCNKLHIRWLKWIPERSHHGYQRERRRKWR
jgi:hypothetical protein